MVNFSPLSRKTYLSILVSVQIMKLLLILSQPDTVNFKLWFYGWAHYRPYTFWYKNQGWDSLAAPYSLLWYVFNAPTFWGYFAANFYFLAFDCLFVVVVAKYESQIFGAFYTWASLYFLLASPQDFFILLLMILGKERGFFLVLAPLAKLPMIPPVLDWTVWNFILFSPVSLHDPGNWARYTFLAFWYLLCVGLYLRNHTNKYTKLFNTLESRLGMA